HPLEWGLHDDIRRQEGLGRGGGCMSESIIDILRGGRGFGTSSKIYGVVVGIVTNNQDPDGLGRVRVKFPWLSSADEVWWARVAAPSAAKENGVYFLPNVDDEVLLAFEHGDVR